MNLPLLIHIVAGSLVLFSGLLIIFNIQHAFWYSLYSFSSLIVVSAAFFIVGTISYGLLAQSGFILLAGIWIISILCFMNTSKKAWFIRSYALALTVISRRMWTALFTFIGLDQALSYTLGLWLGWTINVLVAEVIIKLKKN